MKVLGQLKVFFCYTRKNFPDSQKLSGMQCLLAHWVFLPLNQPIQDRVEVKAVGKVGELQNLSPTFYPVQPFKYRVPPLLKASFVFGHKFKLEEFGLALELTLLGSLPGRASPGCLQCKIGKQTDV